MDPAEKNRAMNEDAKQVALQVRPTEPGSWTRLLEYALEGGVHWAGEPLVALLSVAYEIGHQDGESEADMYGKEAQLRQLCDDHMVDAEGGGRTDASEIWPSWVLEILDKAD